MGWFLYCTTCGRRHRIDAASAALVYCVRCGGRVFTSLPQGIYGQSDEPTERLQFGRGFAGGQQA